MKINTSKHNQKILLACIFMLKFLLKGLYNKEKKIEDNLTKTPTVNL